MTKLFVTPENVMEHILLPTYYATLGGMQRPQSIFSKAGCGYPQTRKACQDLGLIEKFKKSETGLGESSFGWAKESKPTMEDAEAVVDHYAKTQERYDRKDPEQKNAEPEDTENNPVQIEMIDSDDSLNLDYIEKQIESLNERVQVLTKNIQQLFAAIQRVISNQVAQGDRVGMEMPYQSVKGDLSIDKPRGRG